MIRPVLESRSMTTGVCLIAVLLSLLGLGPEKLRLPEASQVRSTPAVFQSARK
jgi:hypothetical protein